MKHFLVINTSYFGDTILTSSLCRNIKSAEPDSKIVFIANKPFIDVARYMDGVDEAWIYEKWGKHKGLKGFRSFIKEYKGRYDFDAAFVIYGNDRGIIMSKILGAKRIMADTKNIFLRVYISLLHIDYKDKIHMQDRHAFLWELYSGKPMESFKMQYNVPAEAKKFVQQKLLAAIAKPVIALNPVTKNKAKDLKPQTICELADKITAAGMQPAIIGAGQDILDYYTALPEETKEKLLNLINKTTIPQLGALLQSCRALISADTGTAHFALALDVPVVDVFYINNPENLRVWGPKPCYRHKLIADGDFSSDYIWQQTLHLMEECQ